MLTKNIDEMKAVVADHIAADQVVQGRYWENNRGCFIGCLTHSSKSQLVTHKFGMPLPLVCITERVFDRLTEKESVKFFADIPAAIDIDGKDLSLIHWQFLRDTLLRLPKITSEIKTVIKGISLLAKGEKWNKEKVNAAASASVNAAAKSVNAAAWAAAWGAKAAYEAEDAAYAAAYMVRAADYAAKAAAYAGFCAARAERSKQAQSIIQLLKDAPIKETK